jgi:predicted RNase H-like nuclease (RuvC/YqgF family)
MDNITVDNITLVHHERNDVMELVIAGPEGTDRLWLTYEEIASLKKILRIHDQQEMVQVL